MKKISIIMVLLLLFSACSNSLEESIKIEDSLKETNVINNHGFVDLGLSSGTLWACANIGASTPFEPGDYYAWGETETKENYSSKNYIWGWPPSKYNEKDGKKKLDSNDDVATIKWGDKCRMPSKEEFLELVDECKWVWKSNFHGINGYLVNGINGNCIFLPASGYKHGTRLDGYGCYASYRTSEISNGKYDDESKAVVLMISDDGSIGTMNDESIIYGHIVRPVSNRSEQKPSEDDNNNDGNNNQGDIEKYQKIEDGVVYNTCTSNKLVGNWSDLTYFILNSKTYYSYEVYSFGKDMKYKIHEKSLGTNSYERKSIGTYSFDDTYITLVDDNGGKTIKRKYEWVSQDQIKINNIRYYATTLSGLDANDVPKKDESSVKVSYSFEDNGDLGITLIPNWGISNFYYTLSKRDNEPPTTKRTSPTIVKYKNLEPGETYYLRTYGIDKKGISHTICNNLIKNLGTKGVTNRMVYYGKNHNLISAEMSCVHASGTSNRNWKKLIFSDDEGCKLYFTYTTPYYEGITKEWAEGTYKITISNDCYKYNAAFYNKSGKSDGVSLDGKLTIKKRNSNYYVFDFDLDVLKGHFEGTME